MKLHEMREMSRQQALTALAAVSPDPEVRRLVALMQTGPEISDEDAARLAGSRQRLSPIAKAVRRALA